MSTVVPPATRLVANDGLVDSSRLPIVAPGRSRVVSAASLARGLPSLWAAATWASCARFLPLTAAGPRALCYWRCRGTPDATMLGGMLVSARSRAW